MVPQNSLQPNHGFYGKSIHSSFISWLKNPSNLQTEVKKVLSQTFDNQEAVFTYTWIIQSTLHSQHSEHRCPVWWALEFWGGLASAHYWNQQPKKHQEGDKSPPWEGQVPQPRMWEGQESTLLRESNSNLLPTEGASLCIRQSLVTRGHSSRLGLRSGTFQPQILRSYLWAGKVSFLSGSEDCLDVCSLSFSAVSSVDQVLLAAFSSQFIPSLQKSLPPGTATPQGGMSVRSPARKSPGTTPAWTGQRWWLPRCCTAILSQKDQNVMTYSRQKGHRPLHISKRCHL